jgi:putative membrane protein
MILKQTSSKFLLFSAAILMSGATAIAQSPGSMGQQQPNQQPGQQTGQPPYAGQDASGTNPGAGPSPGDQEFVRSVFESDAAELQLGQMAQDKSQSDDVKQFGQQMLENRKRLDDQMKQIAGRLQVNEPKGPSKKDKELIAKLETLSGPQFDEEYIRAVVKDHEKNVKDFNSEAKGAQDPSIQQAAKMDAPVLAQHLQAIEQIAQTHNVAVDVKK